MCHNEGPPFPGAGGHPLERRRAPVFRESVERGSVLSSKVELRAEELTVRYTQWLLRWRWPIIITVLLASALTCYGFRYFVLDNDYRVFFSHDDPKLLDYEALQNAYTKDETLFFIVTSKSGEVFDRETLAALGELTESAWQLPHVLRVDSVTNFQYVSSRGRAAGAAAGDQPAEMSDESSPRAKRRR
jgi:predicted RND superfamily exporter protein